MIRLDDQVAVGLRHYRPAGGGQHAAGRAATRTVNHRAERLARYAAARRRTAPRTSLKAFEALVAETLDELPAYVQHRLENVAGRVEEWAGPERVERTGYDPRYELLGLYEG